MSSRRFGVVTTWNQDCGLATYAGYMLKPFAEGEYFVLAEDCRDHTRDEPYVVRCWSRESSNYEPLLEVVEATGIELLHLNIQVRFFQYPEFSLFLKQVRNRGIKVIAHLHSIYTLDRTVSELADNVDMVLVHSPEVRLEVIANGVAPEKVAYIPHGVIVREGMSEESRNNERRRYGVEQNEKLIVGFGFVQPHKGMEGIIEAVHELRKAGMPVKGVIAGKARADDPSSTQYLEQLQKATNELSLGSFVKFTNCFLKESKLIKLLQSADVVLMNYHSQYYEASGACALALGCGALVATSIAPPFTAFGDAVWHLTSGFPTPLSMQILLENVALRTEVLENARRYCSKNSWSEVHKMLLELYAKLGFAPSGLWRAEFHSA